jgi:hypothetical protein
MRSYVKEKVATPVYKTKITAVGDTSRWPRDTPLSAKFGNNFADKRRSLGQLVRSRTQAKEFVFVCFVLNGGARGSVVVKALFYKPEGRGFHTLMRWFFKFT